MSVYKDSDKGKALVKALGDSSRIIIPANEIDAKIASVEKVAGDDLPIHWAGENGRDSVMEAGTESLMFGLVAAQEKDGTGKTVSAYKCGLIAPAFSIDAIMESGDNGRDWLAKIAEKESAHVYFRPVRNAEAEGESLENAARMVPVTIESLTSMKRAGSIDTSAIEILWPLLRHGLSIATDESGNPDKASRGLVDHLPSDGAIATVQKMLRSAKWAEKHVPALESRGLVQVLGEQMVLMASEPIPTGETDENNEPVTIDVDASVIESWLEARDTFEIPVPVPQKPKDESALDAFLAAAQG